MDWSKSLRRGSTPSGGQGGFERIGRNQQRPRTSSDVQRAGSFLTGAGLLNVGLTNDRPTSSAPSLVSSLATTTTAPATSACLFDTPRVSTQLQVELNDGASDRDHRQTMTSIENALARWNQFADTKSSPPRPQDQIHDQEAATTLTSILMGHCASQAAAASSTGGGGLQMLNDLRLDEIAERNGSQEAVGEEANRRPVNTSYHFGVRRPRLDEHDKDSVALSNSSGCSQLTAQSAPDRIQLKRKAQKVPASRLEHQRGSVMSFNDSLLEHHHDRIVSLQLKGHHHPHHHHQSELLRPSSSPASVTKPSSRHRRPSLKTPGKQLGPFEVSEQTYNEVVSYRRSLLLLTFAFIYTLFALCTTLFKPDGGQDDLTPLSFSPVGATRGVGVLDAPGTKMRPHHPDGEEDADWTQEQIAGWYRDHPLVVSGELFRTANIRIRECHSSVSLVASGIDLSLLQQHLGGANAIDEAANAGATTASENKDNNDDNNKATRPSSTATKKPTKRKFEALNGCMFRRDAKSDLLGDLCCCSGVPKFVQTNRTSQEVEDLHYPSTGSSTIAPAEKWNKNNKTTATETGPLKPPARKYLKPHLMCFVSAAGSLFNAQKIAAPLVNEQNLRNANIQNKAKCIPCSCCHEHEPEMVNKLLANVPLTKQLGGGGVLLAEPKATIDAHGRQLATQSGVWVSLRERLVSSMQSLDEFFFHFYDMLDLALFSMRFGSYPLAAQSQDQTHSGDPFEFNVIPLGIAQQFGGSGHSASGGDLQQDDPKALALAATAIANSQAKALAAANKQASLLIDADAYDDFKLTTTTSTTSTSTKRPSTMGSSSSPGSKSTSKLPRRPKGRKRKKKRRRKQQSSTATSTRVPASGANSATLPTGPTTASSSRGTRPENASLSHQQQQGSSTTKSPTVIINVYAENGRQQGGGGAGTTKSSSSSTKTSMTTTTTTTSTSKSTSAMTTNTPSIMLIAKEGPQLSSRPEAPPVASTQQTNFALHIELRPPSNGTSTTTTTSSPRTLTTNATDASPTMETPWQTQQQQQQQQFLIGSPDQVNQENISTTTQSPSLSVPKSELQRTALAALPGNGANPQPRSIVISLERGQPTATIMFNASHLDESIFAFNNNTARASGGPETMKTIRNYDTTLGPAGVDLQAVPTSQAPTAIVPLASAGAKSKGANPPAAALRAHNEMNSTAAAPTASAIANATTNNRLDWSWGAPLRHISAGVATQLPPAAPPPQTTQLMTTLFESHQKQSAPLNETATSSGGLSGADERPPGEMGPLVSTTTTGLDHSTARLIVPTAANINDRAATRGSQHNNNNNLQTTTKLDSNAGGGQWLQLAPLQRSTGNLASINKLAAGSS